MNAVTAHLKSAGLGDRFVRRFAPLYSGFRRELELFDRAGFEERSRLQQRLIDETLAGAARLPGYARFDGLPLCEWSHVDKTMLQSGQADFESAGGLFATNAQTSGSSGVPLSVRRSFASVVFEQAAIDHVVSLAGGDFARDRVAVFRGEAIKDPSDNEPPFWRVQSGGRVMNFSVAHLHRDRAGLFLDTLREFRPGVLWAYPSALELLVNIMEDNGSRLTVPVILTSSEVLTDDLRARAESLFQARVADYYGQAERVCFAYALEAGQYRFMPAYGAVELDALDGYSGARFAISATNLRNAAQPLVRYRIGDVAVLDGATGRREREEVALGLRSFARIEGRENDYLLAPDGTRLIGMNHIPRGIEGLLQMQLRQDAPDHIRVLAVPRAKPGEALGREIAERVTSRLPEGMRVDVEFCDAIPRQPGGKQPFVVRSADL
ncbi:hypothetical protein [Oricola indica]|jgi:phenylacetate-CoA ligase|uniref:hypothetical protein n=1 Tax=Oricola indica TaxID=2872591 RepID=UPI001CBC0C0F|nr:hypothetical protein [Oricola indica]